MDFLGNFDLLSVGVAVAGTLVLGFATYFSDTKSSTNRIFLVFTLVTVIWGVLNFLSYRVANINLAFWFLRTELALGVWQAFYIFKLFRTLSQVESNNIRNYDIFLIPVVIITSLLCLTPLVLVEVKELTLDGYIKTLQIAPGIILFAIVSIGLVLLSFLSFFKKIREEQTKKIKQTSTKPIRYFLYGSVLMFSPLIILNFIFPAFLDDSRFIPFGAVTIFPFIAFTSYAILRHHLFSVRAMWAGVLVFLLAVTTFFEVIFAGEFGLILYRGAVFLLLLFFGILLIKGIIRETKQREEIQELASRLKNVNSILAHDIKNVLGKNRDMFVETLAGTFGEITDQGKGFLKRLGRDTSDLIASVTNILKSGNEVKPDPKPFDFKEAVLGAAASVKDKADEEKIKIEIQIDEQEDYTVNADRSLIVPHVLKNLLENAVNYSVVNGSIWINLSKKDQKTILLTIKDNGWGMTEDDQKVLFKLGGHGPDSIKKNVHTSGFGLAIAKQTIDAHNGKVYGISEGRNKGSTFFVELPVDFTSTALN